MSFRLEIHFKENRYGEAPDPEVQIAQGKPNLEAAYIGLIKRKDVAFVRVGYSRRAEKEGDRG